MAQGAYEGGVPKVAPDSAPSTPYQRINATAESFGADIARGTQALGTGALEASRFWGKVQTDDVLNNAMKEANDVTEEFKNMKGADALNAQPQIEERLNKISEDAKGKLTSAEQQLAFSSAYRPFRERYIAGQIRSHAVSQGHTFATNTNKSTYDNTLSMIPNAGEDHETVSHLIGDMANAGVKQAELDGLGDEAKLGAVRKAQADGYKTWIDAIAVKDPLKAASLADQYKKELGVNYTHVAGKVRSANEHATGVAIADEESGHRQPQSGPVANVPAEFVSAIKQSEGFVSKAKWDNKQYSYGYGTRAAGEGATITREQADKEANAEISKAAKLVDSVNPNLDPGTRAALTSLTYNAGPTWATSGLGEKVRAGDIEGSRQAFMQYVRAGGQVNEGLLARRYREAQWFGQTDVPQGGQAPLVAKQEAYERVLDRTGDNPTAQAAAVARLNQIYSMYRSDTTAKSTAFKQRVTDSTTEAMTTGAVQTPLSESDFVEDAINRGHPIDAGIAQYQEYQKTLLLGADIQGLSAMSEPERFDLFASYMPKPGQEGYADQVKRLVELDKADKAIQKAKKDDPGGFAILRLPAVRDAYAKLQASQSPEERRKAADNFVLTTLAEQERVGIPRALQAVLPTSYIATLNQKLSQPQTEGGSANVAADIATEAQLWGNHWPDVYRQLAKETQPVVRVIGSGVKPLAAQILSDLAPVSLKAILADDNATKDQTIKDDVLTAFKPFAKTMTGQDGAIQVFNDFRGQAEKLAAYYVVRGSSSSEAATKAYDDLVGHKYDFKETYRVPKSINIPANTIEGGADEARHLIGTAPQQFDFAPARDTMGGLTEQYLSEATRKAYVRDGKWVTSPDETGLVLTYNDQAIRMKNGGPLFLSWKQLEEFSATRAKRMTELGRVDRAIMP